MLLSDLDLQETYRAIDSVATVRIPSLSCAYSIYGYKLIHIVVTLMSMFTKSSRISLVILCVYWSFNSILIVEEIS